MSDADDDDAPQTVDELRAKLDEYARSLADVEASLADAPGDEELIDLKDSLEDVIEITRDVLATTLAARDDGDDDDARGDDGANDARGSTAATATTTTTLGGTFAGRDVLALDDEGAWRKGRCVRAMDDGTLDVYLTETHTRVAVKASDVRIDIGDRAKAKAPPPPPPREVYRGVPEPRRLELTRKTEFVRKEPPKNLEIKPGDDSETRELKRKKLKTFKYKQRQQEISAEQNQKASSWQNFQSKGLKKGKKGIQKNSIFALPEDLTEAKGVGFAGSKPVGNR